MNYEFNVGNDVTWEFFYIGNHAICYQNNVLFIIRDLKMFINDVHKKEEIKAIALRHLRKYGIKFRIKNSRPIQVMSMNNKVIFTYNVFYVFWLRLLSQKNYSMFLSKT